MELFHKIQSLIHRPTKEEVAIVQMYNMVNNLNDHLIALARLAFIKPEALHREAKNVKSNAEYLLKMIEEMKNETKNS
jgi:hypothetical protein